MKRTVLVLCLSLFLSGCGPTQLDLMKQQYRESMAKASTSQEKTEIQRDYEIKLREYEIELMERNYMLLNQRALQEYPFRRFVCP